LKPKSLPLPFFPGELSDCRVFQAPRCFKKPVRTQEMPWSFFYLDLVLKVLSGVCGIPRALATWTGMGISFMPSTSPVGNPVLIVKDACF